jgi:hypothetical protein
MNNQITKMKNPGEKRDSESTGEQGELTDGKIETPSRFREMESLS